MKATQEFTLEKYLQTLQPSVFGPTYSLAQPPSTLELHSMMLHPSAHP